MKKSMRWLFGEGVFCTGWGNAIICIGLAVAVFFTNQIYAVLNHGPAVLNLRTPLDAALPVVLPFVVPYVSLEPLVYVTLIAFLVFRTRTFQSACLSLITAWLISYAFYFFLQTEVLRPVLTGTDVFTHMIQGVYASDQPYNDFPSLHTSISVILAIHWFRVSRKVGIVVSIWTALIVASTVLIKQHYIADVISGLLLAFGVSWLYLKVIPRKATPLPSQSAAA